MSRRKSHLERLVGRAGSRAGPAPRARQCFDTGFTRELTVVLGEKGSRSSEDEQSPRTEAGMGRSGCGLKGELHGVSGFKGARFWRGRQRNKSSEATVLQERGLKKGQSWSQEEKPAKSNSPDRHLYPWRDPMAPAS